MQLKPPWFDEWVIPDMDNWHLKENAPEWEKYKKGDRVNIIKDIKNNCL